MSQEVAEELISLQYKLNQISKHLDNEKLSSMDFDTNVTSAKKSPEQLTLPPFWNGGCYASVVANHPYLKNI
jgi:hypothetical protein